jgi:uncharacterized protein involved in exopolysaccharide biosynthesis
MLEELRATLRGRLDKLAGMRAEYSSLAADMKHRTTLVEKAQRDLAEARAAQAAAHSASLISPVDRPEAGNRPVGPSFSLIVSIGLIGGLLTGLGVVFLTVPYVSAAEAAPPVETAKPARHGATGRRGPRHVLSLNEALERVFPLTTRP